MEELPAGVVARKDYNAEGKKLIASLGVATSRPGGAAHAFNNFDAIYKDAKTGATIYVGNEVAARGPASKLLAMSITHVVNCTDDMPNYCEVPATFPPHPKASDPRLQYLRFNVAHWASAGDPMRETTASDAEIGCFIQRLFAFVDDALTSGGSVLVHCLAGAHRAGTTGVLLLMWRASLSSTAAIQAARCMRPVINPIGSLPEFLRFFDERRAVVLGDVPT